MHFKQERKINKEIGVVVCLGLYSEDRVLSNPKVLEDCSVPSVVLMVLMVLVPHFFCLPWAFQPLGVKCGPLAPHISDGAALPELLLSLCSLIGESGDMVVCSAAALVSPPVSICPRRSPSIFPSCQKVTLKRTSGQSSGRFSIHQKICFVRQTQCTESSYIALLSSKLLW